MTDKGFIVLFETIQAGAGRALTESEKDFWRMMLAKDDDKSIMNKLVGFYRSGEAGKRKERIPAPGDLIEQGDSAQTKAALAWATVRKAISEHGAYVSVLFEDGAIAAAVESLGGWIELCGKSSTDLDDLAWQFQRVYPVLIGAPRKVMLGLHEASNRANGHVGALNPPVAVPTIGKGTSLPALGDGSGAK